MSGSAFAFIKGKLSEIVKIALGVLTLICAIILTGILGDGYWWLFLVPYFISGADTLIKTVKNIARLEIFDENFLMSIATVGALIIGEYPEAVLVMLLYKVGECFEDIAVERSRAGVFDLFRVSSASVKVERDNAVSEISLDELQIGDIVLLVAGDTVCADSVIVEGEGVFDTSHLTGESVPVICRAGDTVYSGSINQGKAVKLRIQRSPSESMAAKIMQITEQAAARRSKTEKFISRFARIYTPAVVLCAAVIAFIPPLFYESYLASLSIWGYRALIFLVVSCPCALVISVPLGFFAGIGAAAKNGILIKSSGHIEALSKAYTVVFDKTGTLTKGQLSVVGVNSEQYDRATVLNYASSLEKYSNHPAAHAVCAEFSSNIACENVIESSGQGMKGMLNSKLLLCGNMHLMKENSIDIKEYETKNTVIYVAYDGEYIGCIELADTMKENAPDTINKLRKIGVRRTVMLTGDRMAVAEEIAQKLSVDSFKAELLPDGKLKEVELMCLSNKRNERLIYVGDGINDTPSLARADIGVSMGALGSDAAIEQADVVLMDDDPCKIVHAIMIAKRTMRAVVINIVFALSVKLVVMLLGAMGLAGMGAAVFADVGVSVIAVMNSVSILKNRKFFDIYLK